MSDVSASPTPPTAADLNAAVQGLAVDVQALLTEHARLTAELANAQQAMANGAGLDRAWDALKLAGIWPDATTPLEDAITVLTAELETLRAGIETAITSTARRVYHACEVAEFGAENAADWSVGLRAIIAEEIARARSTRPEGGEDSTNG